jgi:hypothetical protein
MNEQPVPPVPPVDVDKGLNDLMSLFDEVSYFGRLKQMFSGLKQPKDSREYKMARIEVQRLAAPAAAVLFPTVVVLMLVLLATGQIGSSTAIEVNVLEVEETKELQKEEVKPEDRPEIETDVKFDSNLDLPNAPINDQPMTAQPQTFDAVMNVKSPVVLRGIFGSQRNTGMRGQMLARGGGDALTEAAVMRALRWLKKNQAADGSWRANKTAMTGMALLCFLAHGEKPGESREFGETVQKAIEFLISVQPADGKFPGSYHHPIATYALCEAYGMTQNPNVKVAAEKGIYVIINGQHPSGGWNYGMVQDDRDDTSVMGWAAQALKAAKMANVCSDVAGLDKACKLSVRGFQKNANPSGGFGYTSPAAGGLSGVGTLCMQFHGAGNKPEVVNTLALMDAWKCSWANPLPAGSSQYYFYYATQAKFHAGGARWKSWNAEMKPEYLKAQIIIPKDQSGYLDADGNPQEIGNWVNNDAHTDRPVMDTCLAALQLMVYYRYLPTTSADAVKVDEEVIKAVSTDTGDIKVNTGNL